MAVASTEFVVDPKRTTITMYAKRLGIDWKVGKFDDFSGTFTFDPDRPEQGAVFIRVATSSIRTNYEFFDRILRGPDYFSTTEYPEMTFTSHRIETTGTESGIIHALLNLRGISREVALDTQFKGIAQSHHSDQSAVSFSATLTVRRSDFGIKKFLLVGDHITVKIEMEGYPVAEQTGQAGPSPQK